MRAWSLAFLALLLTGLPGCGYHALQGQDEVVQMTWAEVLSAYRSREDLVSNLARTARGYADQQVQELIRGAQASALEAGAIQLTPEIVHDPAAFARYQAAQHALGASLKALFALSDSSPQLMSDANFRDLEAQLQTTEVRIAVARSRYIDAVHNYNLTVGSFPSSLTARVFDFQVKPNFTVAEDQAVAQAAPQGSGEAPERQVRTAAPGSATGPGTPAHR